MDTVIIDNQSQSNLEKVVVQSFGVGRKRVASPTPALLHLVNTVKGMTI